MAACLMLAYLLVPVEDAVLVLQCAQMTVAVGSLCHSLEYQYMRIVLAITKCFLDQVPFKHVT